MRCVAEFQAISDTLMMNLKHAARAVFLVGGCATSHLQMRYSDAVRGVEP